MVRLLDRSFRFTTSHSLERCKELLEHQSKRSTHLFASKRSILVATSYREDALLFELNRDVGRGLYAVVRGSISKDADGRCVVLGKGSVGRSTLLVTLYMVVIGSVLAFAFRFVPIMLIFIMPAPILALAFLFLSVNNRNYLISVVTDALTT
jgi:hypothetical protein